jgi:hypothetical protein
MADRPPDTDVVTAERVAIPARRRSLFEGPRFWIGLIAFGLVLAFGLSFLPARGDTASAKPDVDAFCQQVGVLKATDLLSLVAGAGSQLFVPTPVGPGGGPTPTTSIDPESPVGGGSAADQLSSFEQQLVALERVAPHEVRTDVHDVRLAVDDVLTSLHKVSGPGAVPPTSLLFAVSDAQAQIQEAIGRLSGYVHDTCGIDLQDQSIRTVPFGR